MNTQTANTTFTAKDRVCPGFAWLLDLWGPIDSQTPVVGFTKPCSWLVS